MKWVAGIWFAMNVGAYFSFWLDKRRAQKGRRRIRESTLLWLSACGGALGAWQAMKVFRHKTRNRQFSLFIPLFMMLQAGALCWIAYRWAEPIVETYIVSFAIVLMHFIVVWNARNK